MLEIIFVEGVSPMEVVARDVRTASVAIPPSSPRSQGSRGLSEIQRRNRLVTPPRGPLNRLPAEQTEKNTEEYEFIQDNPASNAEELGQSSQTQ